MKNEWIFAFLTALLPILKTTYDFILKLYQMRHAEKMLENIKHTSINKYTKKKKVPTKPSKSSATPKA